jgi:uncharacterized protein YifN (PemK superfamily)
VIKGCGRIATKEPSPKVGAVLECEYKIYNVTFEMTKNPLIIKSVFGEECSQRKL